MNVAQATRARNAQIARLENEIEELQEAALLHAWDGRLNIPDVWRCIRRKEFEIVRLQRLNQKENGA